MRSFGVAPSLRRAWAGRARGLALVACVLTGCDDGPRKAGDWAPEAWIDGPPVDAFPVDAASDAASADTGPDAAAPDASPDATSDAAPDAAAPADCAAELALGRRRLEESLPREALHAFEAALALCPDDPDAIFGAALAGAIDSVELTWMLFSVLGQIGGLAISRDEYLAEEIHGELMGLRAELQRALDRVAALDPADVDFEVDGAGLYLGVHPTILYRGVFDGGDLHLFRASLSMALALMDIFAAQDLATDLLDLVNALRGDLEGLDFATIGQILGDLLSARGERFFRLHPVDGERVFAESRAHFGAVGRELVAAVALMSAEDDPRPQVSRVDGEGARFRLVVNGLAQDDGTETPLVVTFDEDTMAAFAHASRAFTEPGELVPFQTEAIPIIATLLQVGARLGIVDTLLGGLPIDLGALDRTAVQALLERLMPMPVALDFHAYYENPTGLRPMMPRTAGDPRRLLAEWECPGDLDERGLPSAARGILCDGDAALVDGPHFADTPWAIAADGIGSRFPALVWDDPTWNGLLWVDLSALGVPGWEAPGWRRPDLFALNVAVSVGLGPFFTLLGGAL